MGQKSNNTWFGSQCIENVRKKMLAKEISWVLTVFLDIMMMSYYFKREL